MRELVVYGGPLSLPYRGQERAVVLVVTKVELQKVLKALGAHVNARIIRDYWCETANDRELAAAHAAGRGVVLARPYNDWNGEYRPVVVSDNA